MKNLKLRAALSRKLRARGVERADARDLARAVDVDDVAEAFAADVAPEPEPEPPPRKAKKKARPSMTHDTACAALGIDPIVGQFVVDGADTIAAANGIAQVFARAIRGPR